MRSNSGKDECRNNLHDPTMRDRNGSERTIAIGPKSHAKAPADHRQGRKD